MKQVGVLSDTHGYYHPRVSSFFADCDEIWHAGDIGNYETYKSLTDFKKVRAVFGNIDGGSLRVELNEYEIFTIEDLKVVITHIGGYPGKYTPLARKLIKENSPDIFITGHSHILKIIHDNNNNLLHINPGAAGNFGIHQVITMVKFKVESGNISDLEIFESERK